MHECLFLRGAVRRRTLERVAQHLTFLLLLLPHSQTHTHIHSVLFFSSCLADPCPCSATELQGGRGREGRREGGIHECGISCCRPQPSSSWGRRPRVCLRASRCPQSPWCQSQPSPSLRQRRTRTRTSCSGRRKGRSLERDAYPKPAKHAKAPNTLTEPWR